MRLPLLPYRKPTPGRDYWVIDDALPDAAAADGTRYDTTLQRAARALQQARGLPADGIAGPLTLMALADPPGPRLLRVLE